LASGLRNCIMFQGYRPAIEHKRDNNGRLVKDSKVCPLTDRQGNWQKGINGGAILRIRPALPGEAYWNAIFAFYNRFRIIDLIKYAPMVAHSPFLADSRSLIYRRSTVTPPCRPRTSGMPLFIRTPPRPPVRESNKTAGGQSSAFASFVSQVLGTENWSSGGCGSECRIRSRNRRPLKRKASLPEGYKKSAGQGGLTQLGQQTTHSDHSAHSARSAITFWRLFKPE